MTLYPHQEDLDRLNKEFMEKLRKQSAAIKWPKRIYLCEGSGSGFPNGKIDSEWRIKKYAGYVAYVKEQTVNDGLFKKLKIMLEEWEKSSAADKLYADYALEQDRHGDHREYQAKADGVTSCVADLRELIEELSDDT